MSTGTAVVARRSQGYVAAWLIIPAAVAGIALVALLMTGRGPAGSVDPKGSGSPSHSLEWPATTLPPRGVTFYLVESDAQAGLVLRNESDAAVVKAGGGDTSPGEQVNIITIKGADDLRRASIAIADTNAARQREGVPEAKVVDLRGGAR